MTDRDRDDEGRPRNGRPRDALGRPLPYGEHGVEAWDDTRSLTPAQLLVEAQRLLDGGLPFQAHEALEAAWKSAPADERELWQGLAQLAVGITHAARGNPAGARTLLRRARAAIEPFRVDAPHDLDVAGLTTWIDAALPSLGDAPVALPIPRLTRSDEDPVAVLERWARFGGTWTVLERTVDRVSVSLRRCDGGEEQSRLVSSDERLLSWLDEHAGPPG